MKRINKNYVVYKATNVITGKVYIGQTSSFNDRKRNHESEAFNPNSKAYNTYFHRSLRKYGLESFEWEILKECESQKLMDECEIFFVDFYDSVAPNGYNGIKGGRCNATKQAYSVKKSQKGELNHQYGKKGKDSAHHKPVMNKTTGKKYDSIRELCLEEFGDIKYVKYISRVCNDPRRHHYKGSEYCFLNEKRRGNKIWKETSEIGTIREVINLKSKEIYKNMQDASNKMNIPVTMIKDKLYGSIKFSKKYPELNNLDFYQANGEGPEKENTVPSTIENEF